MRLIKYIIFIEAREQVLANLANFAYDPINYGYIRQLQIIDLFLHTLSENNIKLVSFAAAAICNLCAGKYLIFEKIYILNIYLFIIIT